jgi:hypothetical protein
MRSFLPALSLAAATLLVPVQSLYFYIEGTNPKCFFERLPKDTLVVGQYKAEEFNLDQNRYVKNDNLNIFISVEVWHPQLPQQLPNSSLLPPPFALLFLYLLSLFGLI